VGLEMEGVPPSTESRVRPSRRASRDRRVRAYLARVLCAPGSPAGASRDTSGREMRRGKTDATVLRLLPFALLSL